MASRNQPLCERCGNDDSDGLDWAPETNAMRPALHLLLCPGCRETHMVKLKLELEEEGS